MILPMEDEPAKGEGDLQDDDATQHESEPEPGAAPSQGTSDGSGLRRTRHDRYLGGVAGGFSRWLGVDPLFLRVGFAISIVWSPATPLLYAALWLTIREEGAERPLLGSIREPGGVRRVASILALGIGAAVVRPGLSDDVGVRLGLLLLAIGALLILGQPGGVGPDPAARPSSSGASGRPHGSFPARRAASRFVATLPGRPGRRQASGGDGDDLEPRVPGRLGWLFLWLVVLVGGAALALDRAGANIRPGVVVSVALLVVAVGLLVGAFRGRARLLVLVGVALTPLWVGFSLGSVPRFEGDGRVDYLPVSAAQIEDEYTHGYGQMRLDLTEVDWVEGKTREIDLGLTAGMIEVSVPSGVEVQLDAEIGLGSGEVLHRWEGRYSGDMGTIEPDFWAGHGTMDLTAPARPPTCDEFYVPVEPTDPPDPPEPAEEPPLPGREEGRIEPEEPREPEEPEWELIHQDPGGRPCEPQPAPEDPAVVKLDVQIGIGYVEVRHVETPV